MFCQFCGKQLESTAAFCPACGKKVSSNQSQVQVQPAVVAVPDKNKPGTDTYDPAAIRLYLRNLRMLECAKEKLSQSWNTANSRINNLGISYSISDPIEKYHTLDSDGLEFLGYGLMFLVIGFIVDAIVNWLFDTHFVRVIGILVGAGFFIFGLYEIISRYVYENKQYDEDQQRYSREVNDNRDRVKRENIEKKQLIPVREGLKKEYDEATALLNKAYAVNIIPQQFRNIYAVYYLYDYLSTSNESLSAALMQCNLEEIKQKLDTIIQQNEQIILNQEIQQAQNEMIIEQNNQQLKQLARMEQNQETAIKYTQIAANNAAASAWIGAANYLQLSDISSMLNKR